MNRLTRLIVLIAILQCTPLIADSADSETFLGVGVSKDVSTDAELFVDGQLKQKGLPGTDYFRKLEVGGEYDYSERLSIRGSLKGVDILGSSGWNRYYIPGVGATLNWYPSRFEISLRQILELWHALDDQPAEIRLKQRIKLSKPFNLKSMEIEPYISEEYLASLNTDDHLVWNRISAGSSLDLTEIISLDLYYTWQVKNGSLDWRKAHVLGTKLSFSF